MKYEKPEMTIELFVEGYILTILSGVEIGGDPDEGIEF